MKITGTKNNYNQNRVEIKKERQSSQHDTVTTGSENTHISEGVHKKWLFMNYIGGDCNLSDMMLYNIDNQELTGSDKNTHIIAMIDVGHEENALDGSWSGARTFYITKDDTSEQINSPVIEDHGVNVDMSSPATLSEFIVNTIKKFPSDYVALILNDHGGGFTGAMADNSDGDFMSVPQIKQALSDAEKITGKKIDIVGLDACLMAQTEVAYEFKDNTSILLASEENEGGGGWTYNEILNKSIPEAINKLQTVLTKRINVSPVDFAKIVVRGNELHHSVTPTFSAIDLTKMDTLGHAVNEFAEAIILSGEKEAIRTAITKSEHYGGFDEPYTDFRDLYHIADLISNSVQDKKFKETAEVVKKALKDSVIANETAKYRYPNANGLSIYAPTNAVLGPEYNYNELNFAKNTQWDEAIKSIGKTGKHAIRTAPRISSLWPDGSVKPQKKYVINHVKGEGGEE